MSASGAIVRQAFRFAVALVLCDLVAGCGVTIPWSQAIEAMAPSTAFSADATGLLRQWWYGSPAIWAPPPVPSANTYFFDVGGTTQRAVINSINNADVCSKYGGCAVDPAVPNGIGWALEGISFIPGLSCYSPSVSPVPYRVFIAIPRWTALVNSVTVDLVERWNALEHVIYVHEAGHASIAVADLAELGNQARSLPSCDAVINFWASAHLFDKMDADQAAYHARLHADCRPEIGCLPNGWMGW